MDNLLPMCERKLSLPLNNCFLSPGPPFPPSGWPVTKIAELHDYLDTLCFLNVIGLSPDSINLPQRAAQLTDHRPSDWLKLTNLMRWCLLSDGATTPGYVQRWEIGERQMPIQKLNRTILEAAIVGFESQKKELDSQIAELRQILNGGTASAVAVPEATPHKRRKISAAGRKAIAEAQRKRWAASKPQSTASSQPAKPKRKLSKAGKAAIVAALKKRWAAKKAAAAKAQK